MGKQNPNPSGIRIIGINSMHGSPLNPVLLGCDSEKLDLCVPRFVVQSLDLGWKDPTVGAIRDHFSPLFHSEVSLSH